MRIAWHGAMLTRVQKFPPLRDLLLNPPPRAAETAAKSIASWRAFALANGITAEQWAAAEEAAANRPRA